MKHPRIYEVCRGRELVIATKHRKEEVIAPVLEPVIGVRCVTAAVDTDLLGTFTGERERTGDALATARKKCALAVENAGADLVIASEGSFGPHPSIPFAACGDEWLVMRDERLGWEVFVRHLTLETNFATASVRSESELMAFAERIGFPEHALVVKDQHLCPTHIVKGITDEGALRSAFRTVRRRLSSVAVETDMRAMYNPTRMKSIHAAVHKLVEKLLSECPSCGAHGFGVFEVRSGLPCAECGSGTRSVMAHVRLCHACGFRSEDPAPHGRKVEDPMYCDRCNP